MSSPLLSAKQKLIGIFTEFDCLPASVIDPLWAEVRAEAKLTLGELGALKNARCTHAGKGRFDAIDICLHYSFMSFTSIIFVCSRYSLFVLF